MNAEDAILAHARWKIRLATYLRNPDGSINADDLGADDHCELGKWIHGDGARHRSIAEYAQLRAAHAQFHRAAADVVRKANAHQAADAEAALGLSSAFGKASMGVVNSIKALAHKVP